MDVLQPASVVTGIGVCIVEKLEETPESGGVPGNMRICYLVPGAIAWDACECGQLALSIQRDYRSLTFPIDSSEETTRSGCQGGPRAYEVLVSLTRCVPGPKVGANTVTPPTCDQLLSAALTMEGDGWAVRTAVECCLHELRRANQITNYRVGPVNRVGPEGNCAGVEMIFKFALP